MAVLPTESVTFTENCKVAADAGVPLTMPVLALSVRGAIEPEATVNA